MKTIANKLKAGDEVRIIAPSSSSTIITQENINKALQVFHSLGLRVSFGNNIHEMDLLSSSSIQLRIKDFHAAFWDKHVKAIVTMIGGFNSNQLLSYIDFEIIKNNPKIFCGYSDITALQNAIYAKTGLVTYSGPHFSTFAMEKGLEYTLDYFKKALFTGEAINIIPSLQWSDDAWFLDQVNRVFYENHGYWIINEGKAEGIIIGGNLSTFQLLHGTKYMPSLYGTILFLEADSITDGQCDAQEFDRQLQSLIHQQDFDNVKALVIGRFENKFNMCQEKLKFIMQTKKELSNLPIIANVDFGHTTPMLTFPIGGFCKLEAVNGKINLMLCDSNLS